MAPSKVLCDQELVLAHDDDLLCHHECRVCGGASGILGVFDQKREQVDTVDTGEGLEALVDVLCRVGWVDG